MSLRGSRQELPIARPIPCWHLPRGQPTFLSRAPSVFSFIWFWCKALHSSSLSYHSTYCSLPDPSWAFSRCDWMNHVPCYVPVFLLNSSRCHPWMSGCLVKNVSQFFPLGREHVQRDRIFSHCQNLARLPSLLRDISYAYFQKAGSLPTPVWTPWGQAVRETRVCVPMGHSGVNRGLSPQPPCSRPWTITPVTKAPCCGPPWVVWPLLQVSVAALQIEEGWEHTGSWSSEVLSTDDINAPQLQARYQWPVFFVLVLDPNRAFSPQTLTCVSNLFPNFKFRV